MRLWDVTAATPRGQPLAGHDGEVRWGAFSPDGRLLATGGADGTVRLWDVAAAAPRGQPLAGHDGKVRWGAFSPDGRLLATGGEDYTMRLWDVAAAAPRGQPLARHLGETRWGAFSPDGRLLATGGGAETVRLWEATDASLTPPAVVPDAAEGEDLLDLSADVDALANVIVAKSTTPPLSIGLFGDWGAGKSFFIELVQERVRVYARHARKIGTASHCAHVRNVEFNAWHYADANLWASLVSHVLDELARPEPDSVVSERTAQAQLARLEEELAARSRLRERLERARAHADRVEARKRLLRWTWGLGLGTTKTLGEVRQDARSVGGWLRLLLPTRRARIAVIGCAAAVGIALGIVLGVADVDRVLRLVAGALAGLGAFAAWIGVGAAHVSRLLERAGDTTTVADIHRDDVDAELEAARTRERELRDELADLASGRRLARFAAERGASEDYRAHLGLVSRIHDDFVRMSEILALQSKQVAERCDPAE